VFSSFSLFFSVFGSVQWFKLTVHHLYSTLQTFRMMSYQHGYTGSIVVIDGTSDVWFQFALFKVCWAISVNNTVTISLSTNGQQHAHPTQPTDLAI